MRRAYRAFVLFLLIGLAMDSSALHDAPIIFTAELVGSSQTVTVFRRHDPKNDNIVIVLPDGRRYWSWYPLSYLLRPGEPPRPREEIPIGGGRVRLGPGWRHVTGGDMMSFDTPRMTCDFRYLGPPDSTSQNGLGLCETTIGEVITIRW